VALGPPPIAVQIIAAFWREDGPRASRITRNGQVVSRPPASFD
jgi:hypothetical protein